MANFTSKQEAFVREYSVEKNAVQAAIRDGYIKKTAHAIGQVNLRKPTISAAQEAHAERCNVTVDSLTDELEEARVMAKKNGQELAMVTATMGKERLHGLIVDKAAHNEPMSYREVLDAAKRTRSYFGARDN